MTKILLIVKDRTLSELVRISVTNTCGHFLEAAADGIEAIEKCRTNDFDLVIMDLKLDGVNGSSLLAQIRHLVGAYTPLIGLASEPRHFNLLECAHVVQKPFSAKELHHAISSCLT